jgi:YggT family protein
LPVGRCGGGLAARARERYTSAALVLLSTVAFSDGKPASTFPENAPNESVMRALLDVILLVLQLYIYIVIAAAVFSWLVAFNVINTRNHVVALIGDFLYRITEPTLRPIRSVLPNLGGIDISPIILFLIIILIERVIVYYIYPYVF